MLRAKETRGKEINGATKPHKHQDEKQINTAKTFFAQGIRTFVLGPKMSNVFTVIT